MELLNKYSKEMERKNSERSTSKEKGPRITHKDILQSLYVVDLAKLPDVPSSGRDTPTSVSSYDRKPAPSISSSVKSFGTDKSYRLRCDKKESNKRIMKLIGNPSYLDEENNGSGPIRRRDKRYSFSTPDEKSPINKPVQKVIQKAKSYLSCGTDIHRSRKNFKGGDGYHNNFSTNLKESQTFGELDQLYKVTTKRPFNNQLMGKSRSLSQARPQSMMANQLNYNRISPRDDVYYQPPQNSEMRENYYKNFYKRWQRPELQIYSELNQPRCVQRYNSSPDWKLEEDEWKYSPLKTGSIKDQNLMADEFLNKKEIPVNYTQARPFLSEAELKSFNQMKDRRHLSELNYTNAKKEMLLRSRSLNRRYQSIMYPQNRQQEKIELSFSEKTDDINENSSEIKPMLNTPSKRLHSDSRLICGTGLSATTDENKDTKFMSEKYQLYDSGNINPQSKLQINAAELKNNDSNINQELCPAILRPERTSSSDIQKSSDEKGYKSNQNINSRMVKKSKPQKTQLNININVKPVCCSHQNDNLFHVDSSGNVKNWMIECNTSADNNFSSYSGQQLLPLQQNNEISENIKSASLVNSNSFVYSNNRNMNPVNLKSSGRCDMDLNNFKSNDSNVVEQCITVIPNIYQEKKSSQFVINSNNNQLKNGSNNYYNNASSIKNQHFYQKPQSFPQSAFTEYKIAPHQNQTNYTTNVSSISTTQEKSFVKDNPQFKQPTNEIVCFRQPTPKGSCEYVKNYNIAMNKNQNDHSPQKNTTTNTTMNNFPNSNTPEKSYVKDNAQLKKPTHETFSSGHSTSKESCEYVKNDNMPINKNQNIHNPSPKNTTTNIHAVNNSSNQNIEEKFFGDENTQLKQSGNETPSPSQPPAKVSREYVKTDNIQRNSNQNVQFPPPKQSSEQELKSSSSNIKGNSGTCLVPVKQNESSNNKVMLIPSNNNNNEENKEGTIMSLTVPPQIKIIYNSNVSGETKVFETCNGVLQESLQQQSNGAYQTMMPVDSNVQTVKLKDEKNQTVTVINIQTVNDSRFNKDNICVSDNSSKNNSKSDLVNNSINNKNTAVPKVKTPPLTYITNKASSKNVNSGNQENVNKESPATIPCVFKATNFSKMNPQQPQQMLNHEQQRLQQKSNQENFWVQQQKINHELKQHHQQKSYQENLWQQQPLNQEERQNMMNQDNNSQGHCPAQMQSSRQHYLPNSFQDQLRKLEQENRNQDQQKCSRPQQMHFPHPQYQQNFNQEHHPRCSRLQPNQQQTQSQRRQFNNPNSYYSNTPPYSPLGFHYNTTGSGIGINSNNYLPKFNTKLMTNTGKPQEFCNNYNNTNSRQHPQNSQVPGDCNTQNIQQRLQPNKCNIM